MLLKGTTLSLIDAARLVKNILDFMPKNSGVSEIQFCAKIIECGKANFRVQEMSFIEDFKLYILAKAHLRKDSLRDIRYLGNRLIKKFPRVCRAKLFKFECCGLRNAAKQGVFNSLSVQQRQGVFACHI